MDWKAMSSRPVRPLYGERVKEGLRNVAGALPAGAGTEQ